MHDVLKDIVDHGGFDFLTALQLSDSFFPVGTYTFSYGLESFIQEGIVEDGRDLERVVEDYLKNQVGPCDLVGLVNAYSATDEEDIERIKDIDNKLFSLKLPRESRTSSVEQGKKLVENIANVRNLEFLEEYKKEIENNNTPGNYAIALGIITNLNNIHKKEAALMYEYSFTIGLLGPSMRLTRQLDHITIQSILEKTKHTILHVWEQNKEKTEEQMRTFTPNIDIMQMKHEEAKVRIFNS